MPKYKPCFETINLGENANKIEAQGVNLSLGYFFFSKNHNETIKSSLIGAKSPNLVTLLSIATQSIMTLSIQSFFATPSIKTLCISCHYPECRDLFIVMLSVIRLCVVMLSVTIYCYAEYRYAECRYAECHDLFIVTLNVIVLSVIMPSVVMLSVAAPSVKHN
jgi:hypothetical protein